MNELSQHELSQQQCEACSFDAPRVSHSEIERFKAAIPDWQIVERDGIMQLERPFTFRNFKQALAFTNRIGELAEEAGHHPALLTEWGKVTVTCAVLFMTTSMTLAKLSTPDADDPLKAMAAEQAEAEKQSKAAEESATKAADEAPAEAPAEAPNE